MGSNNDFGLGGMHANAGSSSAISAQSRTTFAIKLA
jgi:hypothetical protein